MEMKEFETMCQTGLFQHLTGSDETGCVETEFRVFAAARRPFARAFAVQTSTNTDVRFDADLVRNANGLLELLQLFGNNDDRLTKFATEKCNANKSRIFVAVADDQALRVLLHRERGNQFRFAACFEAKVKLLACVDDLFDHFAQLIDLDRKNAAIFVPITELRHRRPKNTINRFDAVPQQILKSDYERKPKVSRARFRSEERRVGKECRSRWSPYH